MARVLGVGGLFFKTEDTDAMREWYARVLGLDFEDWGGVVFTPDLVADRPGSGTVFSPFESDSDYFAPSTKEFMFNFIVDDLDAMLARCRREGVEPMNVLEDEANGRFAHIVDLEGRKIELWEPKPFSTA